MTETNTEDGVPGPRYRAALTAAADRPPAYRWLCRHGIHHIVVLETADWCDYGNHWWAAT